MNKFSISQLQEFSGIKSHTIRIWEQRYNALTPMRSAGNTRYYDGDQLRRLLNIVSLMDGNFKVSELCLMPDEKLFDLIKTKLFSRSDSSTEFYVSQLISAGMRYDTANFEKILSACISALGIPDTYTRVIYPLLDRVGLMWASDIIPPTQEHFISNMIRQKLFSEIDKLSQIQPSNDTWILCLPENEFHDIGLLFSYFLIRKAGKKVIYLGGSVPLHTLTISIGEINPTSLLLFFVHAHNAEECEKYCNTLAKNCKDLKIYIAGNTKVTGNIKKGKSVNLVQTVTDLENILSTVP